jgi:hypothetical protein
MAATAVSGSEVGEMCLPVKALSIHEAAKNSKYADEAERYPPIRGSTEERCYDSIKHIIQGLRSIHQHVTLVTTLAGTEECDPSKAIPLHYHPLHEQNSSSVPSTDVPTATLPPDVDMPLSTGLMHLEHNGGCTAGCTRGTAGTGSHVCSSSDDSQPLDTVSGATWCEVLKALLIRKAMIVCCTLGREKHSAQNYGIAMMFCRQALYCFAAMKHLMPSKAEENIDRLSTILRLCGDIHMSLAHCGDSELRMHREALKTWPQETAEMMDLLIDEKINSGYESKCDIDGVLDRETFLKRGVDVYRQALDMSRQSKSKVSLSDGGMDVVMKRLGNALNELGVCYMNKAAEFLNNEDMLFSDAKLLTDKSLQCLEEGVSVFSSIGDDMNVAMLLSNKGRLLRLLAQCVVFSSNNSDRQREFTQEERNYYHQAADSYKMALNLLSTKKDEPMVNNLLMSMSWDLSSVYFTMATLLQDYSPISTCAQQQIEVEVIKLMKDALSLCDASLSSVQTAHLQLTIQYRRATVNHRLASLYHNIVRMESNAERRKECRLSAEFHYSVAYKEFVNLIDGCSLEPLRVQLERLMLCDYQFNNQTTAVNKVKTMELALDLILECQVPLKALISQLEEDEVSCSPTNPPEGSTNNSPSSNDSVLQTEAVKLVLMLESRLRTVLLNLLKNVKMLFKNNPSPAVDAYKTMYAMSLQSVQSLLPLDVCRHEFEILRQVAECRRRAIVIQDSAAVGPGSKRT